MKNESGQKTCGMCSMEIPAAARKCPFCHHFQNRLSMFLFHPVFAMMMVCVPMAIMFYGIASMFDTGEEYESYKGQISVTESRVEFGQIQSGPTVAVIGTIRNSSSVPWKDIRLHSDFLNADGKRIDVGEREESSLYLPPNATSSFKLSFRREFPDTNYVKHLVTVSTAKDARARW